MCGPTRSALSSRAAGPCSRSAKHGVVKPLPDGGQSRPLTVAARARLGWPAACSARGKAGAGQSCPRPSRVSLWAALICGHDCAATGSPMSTAGAFAVGDARHRPAALTLPAATGPARRFVCADHSVWLPFPQTFSPVRFCALEGALVPSIEISLLGRRTVDSEMKQS